MGFGFGRSRVLTGYDHGTGHGIGSATKRRKIDIHRVHDVFEIERHLYIKNLDTNGISARILINQLLERLTLAPTNNDNAVPTRSLVPQSFYKRNVST